MFFSTTGTGKTKSKRFTAAFREHFQHKNPEWNVTVLARHELTLHQEVSFCSTLSIRKKKSHRGTVGPFTSQTNRLLPGNVIKKKKKTFTFLLSSFPQISWYNVYVFRCRLKFCNITPQYLCV